jgi:transcriptional regulator with XRE-family HTH domain
VDNRDDIRGFLISRRARITPAQAGLVAYGAARRVPGLRREEVAMLAGVSIGYYTQLERGHLKGVSGAVLDALARALQLDEAERDYLADLARAAATPLRSRHPARQVRPSVRQIVEAMTEIPAFVRDGRLDVLYANQLARALYSPVFQSRGQPASIARFVFADPRSREFYSDWEDAADTVVALLRAEAGRDPCATGLRDLIGQLSAGSEDFRARWAAHNVRRYRTGFKHLRHPVVGELELNFDAMDLPADAGLVLTACTAEPGSASHDALKLLASWATTIAQPGGHGRQDRTAHGSS